ncbi:hypothetical protein PspLS_07656 [Pyricularia sp. CBS 133598]|nr:hypothetical protein PspLS_07656 [Pyricularia sp. CBS 133598]
MWSLSPVHFGGRRVLVWVRDVESDSIECVVLRDYVQPPPRCTRGLQALESRQTWLMTESRKHFTNVC